jgi:DNA-binding NarL/FixJ family response regulator
MNTIVEVEPGAKPGITDMNLHPYLRSQLSDVSDLRSPSRGHLRLLTGMDDYDPVMAGGDHVDRETPCMVRVLLAHGQELVRAGYRALLESDERISVVAEAASSWQALELALKTRPDVALLDEGLPGLDDLVVTAAVVADPAFADVAVALLASSTEDDRVFTAVRAGAVGVLQKDAETEALIGLLHLLALGQAVLPAAAIARLVGGLGPQLVQPIPDRIEELTEREREVVALAAQGLTNGEIAGRLTISPATAKTHISRAMVKLHARHRAQLVVFAYEDGLVS